MHSSWCGEREGRKEGKKGEREARKEGSEERREKGGKGHQKLLLLVTG